MQDTPIYAGYQIARLVNDVPVIDDLGAAGTSIAVDEYGRPWVVNSMQNIYVSPSPGPNGGYQQVEGAGIDIASSGEKIAVLGGTFQTYGYQVYVRDISVPLTFYAWSQEGGQATQISASKGIYGSFFLVNNFGGLYKGI